MAGKSRSNTINNRAANPMDTSSENQSVFRQPLSKEDLLVKAFNPKQVRPTVFKSYASSSLGQIIIDNNKDLSADRKLFNLVTKAPEQSNFELFIDIDFEEFVEDMTDNTIQILEAQINELLAKLAGEQSNNSALQSQLESLMAQLNALQNQPEVDMEVITNTVPDTLVLDSAIYDDRTGLPGAPGAPLRQNMLLSKGRKSRLIIQGDGNVVITLGEFDKNGNQIREDEFVAAFGWSNGEIAPNFLLFTRDNSWDADKKDVLFTVGGLSPSWQARYNGPKIRTSKVTSTPRLTLTDEGLLNVYEGQQLLWTSYGFDFQTGGTYFNYTPNVIPVVETTATIPTPAPPPVVPKTKFSTQMLRDLTFTRSNGTTITLNAWNTLLPVAMNVEIVDSPSGKVLRFNPKLYMSTLPFAGPSFTTRIEQLKWASVVDDTLEIAYNPDDWKQPLGEPIQLERLYKGKVSVNPGIFFTKTRISDGVRLYPDYYATRERLITFKTLYPNYDTAQFVDDGILYYKKYDSTEWNDLQEITE